MKLFLASDHAGFELKEKLKVFLKKKGISFEDLGTDSPLNRNYAQYAARAAETVSADPENLRAILICGSGVGMSIVANKFPGVRAALALTENIAIMSRRHNNCNILCLGAREISAEQAEKIVDAWLVTEFEGGRHQQRLDFIHRLEEKLYNRKN